MRTGAKNIPTNNFEVVLNCTLIAVGLLQDVRPPVVFKGPWVGQSEHPDLEENSDFDDSNFLSE